LLANRVERSQRNLRDFDYLAESLPDFMEYQVITRDGEEIIYMTFTKEPKPSDFKDIKDVADRSSMKVIIDDRPVLPRGYIRSRGSIEYRPVRGRHIETLTFNELRTYAKELGINTSDIDFTNMEAIERGYNKIGVSPVMYKNFLFDETLDPRHGVNRSETDRAKLLARLEQILIDVNIDVLDTNIATLDQLYLTAEYPTDIEGNQKPRKWSGKLRPAQRSAIQRSGVVPEVGQEHYETIIAYNRLRFLNTRQELLNRIKALDVPYVPRKVFGRKASKKEIDKIEKEIRQIEEDTKTKKAWADATDLERNAILRSRMHKSVLNEIADLSNLNVGYRALADVLAPSGSTTFTEVYKIGTQTIIDDNGNEKEGADIYAVSTGRRVYYFTSFQMAFHGNRKVRVFFRTDETGSIMLDPMTGHAFVKVSVTVDGTTLEQVHPVLNHMNKPIAKPDAFAVNTAVMRCLAKAISLHGLGLYIYQGEDLPVLSKKEEQQAKVDEVYDRPETLLNGKAPVAGGITVTQNVKLDRLSRDPILKGSDTQSVIRTFIDTMPTEDAAEKAITKLQNKIKQLKQTAKEAAWD